jgi:hypothetical protein
MSDLPDENKASTTQGFSVSGTLADDKSGQKVADDGTMKAEEPAVKEQKEISVKPFAEGGEETAPIVEVGKTPEIREKGVESWLERLEKGEEVTLPQPIRDDKGRVLVEPAEPSRPKIVLPLTKEEVKSGLHYKVVDSIRWLAEWCLRLIKMTKGKINFAAKKAD